MLDPCDVAGHTVDPARNISVLRLDQTKTLFDLDQIGFHFREVATNGAQMLEHKVDALVTHAGVLSFPGSSCKMVGAKGK